MIEKYAKNIGIVVGALSGTGAMITAIGYLAERSHLAALGFTNIPVDLNQYLYSGLRILAFSPIHNIAIAADILLETVLVLALLSVFAAIIWQNPKKVSFFDDLKSRALPVFKRGKKLIYSVNQGVARFPAFSILILICFQFFGIFWLVNAVGVQNLLYSEPIKQPDKSPIYLAPIHADSLQRWSTNGVVKLDQVITQVAAIEYLLYQKKNLPKTPVYFAPINADSLEKWKSGTEESNLGRLLIYLDKHSQIVLNQNKAEPDNSGFLSPPGVSTMKSWILENNVCELQNYFFKLCCIVFVPIAVLWYVIAIIKKKKLSLVTTIFLVVAFLFLLTQLLFLPINYGVLLLAKTYQEVKIEFNKDEPPSTILEKTKTPNRPPIVANSLRDQEMESEVFKHDLNAFPPIFSDPDGDMLTYIVKSSDETIATAKVVAGWLWVTKNTEDPGAVATIMVTANDGRHQVSDSLTVTCLKDNSEYFILPDFGDWPPIKDQTLVIGDDASFTFDLNSITFGNITSPNEKGKMIYTAKSLNPAQATATVAEENRLVVTPISQGHATIEYTANWGKGWFMKLTLSVEVKHLILLYQTDKEFYLYSRSSKRVRLLPRNEIKSISYHRLAEIY